MRETHVRPGTQQLMQAAAEIVTQLAKQAVIQRGRFSLVLSGGSTPRALYRLLATSPYQDEIEWANVHVFWGDERCVPPDDAESNYRMARESLLDHVAIPPTSIHRICGELSPEDASNDYTQTLVSFFRDGIPRFDLVLLGMGDDGHTASLFPHTAALNETQKWVTANYVPQKDVWRITLTLPVINAARQVIFLVAGAPKAERLREVLYGSRQPHDLPAQSIQPTNGNLLWLVDAAAASTLPHT